MNFADLKTELAARGFDYLSATRQGYFLNRALSEMYEEANWPFLLSTATGTAPLTISDIRTVASVVDSTQRYRLPPLVAAHLLDYDSSLTTTGTPTYYYIDGGAVMVYPANTTNSLSVRYYKAPADLSSDTDEPEVPERFHNLIVDGAAAYAYFDSDNFEAANSLLELWRLGREQMKRSLLHPQSDRPDRFVVSVVDHADATY